MKNIKEEWKDIKGYEGLYQVSNLGRVKSYYTNKILKPQKSPDGYYYVGLYSNSKFKRQTIASLVWDNFTNIPRIDGLQIDHIDSDRTNNRITNLQLLTSRDNNNKKIFVNKKSRFAGVTKHFNKWRCRITTPNGREHLGLFHTQTEAYLCYLKTRISLGESI